MSHENDLPDPARVVLRRRIEWMDTDAAGIYHWTTVFRLAEAAEAALHTALGIADFTFGATPRVKVEATFARSLRFNDPVEVNLVVAGIGRTSVEYAMTIDAAEGTAAQGRWMGSGSRGANRSVPPWSRKPPKPQTSASQPPASDAMCRPSFVLCARSWRSTNAASPR